jgi:hypothetical protein
MDFGASGVREQGGTGEGATLEDSLRGALDQRHAAAVAARYYDCHAGTLGFERDFVVAILRPELGGARFMLEDVIEQRDLGRVAGSRPFRVSDGRVVAGPGDA